MKKREKAHRILALGLAAIIGLSNIPSTAFASEELVSVDNQENTSEPQDLVEEPVENMDETPETEEVVEEAVDVEEAGGVEEAEDVEEVVETETTEEEADQEEEPTINENETTDENDEEASESENTEENSGETTENESEEEADKNLTYIITFVDKDDNEISTQEVKEVSEIELPEAPEVEGFTFVKWDIDIESLELTEDITIKPVYEENVEKTYTVIFVDMEGNEISTQEVKEVSEIELPEAPEVEGYTFIEWDIDLDTLELTEDITVKPIYEEKEIELEHQTLTTTIDNKEISITGNIPSNAELLVKKVVYTKSIQKNIEDALEGDVTVTVYEAFDITIKVGEEEYQPNEFDETVTVSIKNIEVEEKHEEELKVFHIDDSNTVEEVAATVNSDEAEFEADSFSVYVVAGVSYNTEDGKLLDNDYATAYLFEDGTLLVTEFKKGGMGTDSSNVYPWYDEKDNIKTLRLSEELSDIAKSAFEGFSNITGELIIPSSITSIGGGAFNGCSGLTGNLVIPSSVTSIGASAFGNCTGFTGDLVIPDSVTSMGDAAFINCTGFNGTLSIGSGLQDIAGAAFYNCSGLTGELVIPDSIEIIRVRRELNATLGAFEKCTGFTSLKLGSGLVTIQERAFNSCTGMTGELVIPDSVVTLGRHEMVTSFGAVFENTSFTSLHLGSSVEYIGDGTFSNCTELRGNLVIPNSTREIHDNAFYNCGFDGTITLGSGLQLIGNGTFNKCSSLVGDLVIPDSVTSMGRYAFADDRGLTSLTIGSGLKEIAGGAFLNCTGFTGTLTIPDTVETIQAYLSYGTHEGAFQNCTGFSKMDLGNGVSWIQGNAFKDCTGFSGELIIPSSVNKIGHTTIYDSGDVNLGAFSGCTGINKLTFNEGVTIIDVYSFNNCYGITGTIELPASLTNVNNKAFYNCYGIDNIEINSDFTFADNIFFVEPEHRIPTTSNWDAVRGTTTWSDLAYKWNRDSGSYTVSFDTDGGSEVESQTITKGEKAVEPEQPTKEGYEFIGWYKEDTFKNVWNFDTDVVSNNTTIYVKWERIPLVTLKNGDETVSIVKTKYNSYNHSSLKGFWLEKPDNLVRNDAIFKGWSETPDGTTVIFKKQPKSNFENTSNITIDGENTVPLYQYRIVYDITLYAVWEEAPVVTLKDGDKTISTVTTKYNSDISWGATGFWLEYIKVPAQEGYTFTGWSKTPDGSVISFSQKSASDFKDTSTIEISGDKTVPIYQVTQDTTLYAVWEKTPIVILKDGDKTISTVTTKYSSYDKQYYLEQPTELSKEGYSFEGWSKTPDGGTLYFYTLNAEYYKNTSDITINGDKTVPIYQVTADTTLYAVWEDASPVITFKDGNKTVSTQTSKYNSYGNNTYKGYWVEKPEDLTKDDYAFIGWSLTEDGEAIKFKDYESKYFDSTSTVTINGDNTVPVYKVTEDATFYAVWVKNPVVTLKDGDSVITTTKTKYNSHTSTAYNGFWLEQPTEPTKEGYTFKGWSETPDGSTVVFRDTPSSYFENTSDVTLDGNRTVPIYGKVTEDITLYAIWVKNPIGIFKDGDTTISTVISKYNEHGAVEFRGFWMEEPDQPKKDGYKFLGWSLSKDNSYDTISFLAFPKDSFKASDVRVNGDNTVPIFKLTEDITLYAVWQEIIPVIKFMDGETVVSTQTAKYNAKSTSIDNSGYVGYWVEYVEAPYKEGYTFNSWSLVPDSTDISNNISFMMYPADNFKNTSNISMSEWDAGFTNSITKVTEDATFYAVYIKNTYNITFNSNGGSEVKTQSVEHGEKASKPEDPTKEGNKFLGWYVYDWTTGRDKLFDFENTPITQYTFLTAKWEPAKYEVTFDSNGGSEVPAQTIVHGSNVKKPTDPIKEGSELKYWYVEGNPDTPFDFESTPIKDNVKLIAKWEVKKYTVSFDSGTDDEIPDQEIKHGDKIEKPEDPTKEGGEFIGWYPEDDPDTPYDFDEPVKEEIKLVAKWDMQKYEVAFDSNGGSAVPSQTIEHGSNARKPVDPKKEGHTLIGWFTEDGQEFSFDTPIKGDTKLIAKWEISKYEITFDSNGGSEVPPQTIEHGNNIEKPVDPTREGAEFEYWYTEDKPDEPFDFENTPIKEETKLIAKWDVNKYTISFDSNGGSNVPDQEVEHGSNARKPVDPKKEGYTLVGWFTEDKPDEAFDFENTPIKDNVKLIAKWEIKKYTISFDSNGGSDVPDQEVEHNNKVEKPVDPTREGAEFEYWYVEEEPDKPFDFENTPIKDETKLIAKWDVNEYEVIFDSNGGSEVPPQSIEHGDKVKKPVDPTKPDYKFVGWFTEDDKPFDWETPIKEEIKLIAKWEEIVYKTVGFVTNNDQTLDDVKVEQGTPVKVPTGLTKTGYEIEGWYTDAEFTEKWNFNNNVNEDITLYAKWVEKKVIVTPSKPEPTPDNGDSDKTDTIPEPTPTPDNGGQTGTTPEPTSTPGDDEKTDTTPVPTSTPDNGGQADTTPVPTSTPGDGDKTDITPIPTPENDDWTPETTPDITPDVSSTSRPTIIPESDNNGDRNVKEADDSLYMGGLDDDIKNMKGAMARFVEVVKKVAIVISISALAILGILFFILLLIAWLKKVKVLNDYNTDEYQDEDFQVVYKTSVKSEGNRIAELFKSEDRVWTLTIPEEIINERKTDDFEIELKKHFCKKYNGEQLMVILDNEDEEQVISLGFVIDKEDNIIAFTYDEKEENA